MHPAARALLGVAPALIVIAGSFALSRNCVPGPEGCKGVGPGSRSAIVEVTVWPTAEDGDRLHRVALKQETVEDLLTGLINLSDAVERFETFSELGPGRTGAMADESDGAWALKQVLSFSRVRAAQDPGQFGPALARVESAAREFATAPVTN